MATRTVRTRYRLYRKQKILLVGFFMLFLLFYFDHSMKLIVERTLFYKKSQVGMQLLNTAIDDVIKSNSIATSDVITIHYTRDQVVSTITTNTDVVNRLRVQLTDKILAQLKTMQMQTLRIPLGSFSDLQLLQGRGPAVSFKYYPGGYLRTKVTSQFDEAGINQTRHRLVLELATDMNCVGMFQKEVATVSTEYVLAETIVVGTVPQSYSHVLFDDKSKIGLLPNLQPE